MRQWTQRSFRSSGRRRAPTVADLLTIGLLLTASILATGIFQRGAPDAMALVRSEAGEVLLALNKDLVQDFEGPQGVTQIEVHNGFVRIVQAPCRRQLCRRMGRTRSSARSLVCIPNRIRVRIIDSDGEEAIDALAR